MDSTPASIDFAIIGHQDSWQNITALINHIRTPELEKLSVEKIKSIFSFIPPRDIFKINARSKTGTEANGVYIETFIDPDRLDAQYIRTNISKVMNAVAFAKKMGAKIVTLGGVTSIVLEGNLDSFSPGETKFTTGNTLTAAYIVKGIEKAAAQYEIDLQESNILIVGATGDIGIACTNYFKDKAKKLLLCARNNNRLQKFAEELIRDNIQVNYSISLDELIPDADIIICVASSTNIQLGDCKKKVLICDAGYPKNVETTIDNPVGLHLYHGGMGQISNGYHFNPDYSGAMYHYEAPYISHGCVLEAIVLALENKFETYSAGKGNITIDKMEEIYSFSLKHGIIVAPFYNATGLW
jgi:fatty aldehyde-generating acyl-ACP reductase